MFARPIEPLTRSVQYTWAPSTATPVTWFTPVSATNVPAPPPRHSRCARSRHRKSRTRTRAPARRPPTTPTRTPPAHLPRAVSVRYHLLSLVSRRPPAVGLRVACSSRLTAPRDGTPTQETRRSSAPWETDRRCGPPWRCHWPSGMTLLRRSQRCSRTRARGAAGSWSWTGRPGSARRGFSRRSARAPRPPGCAPCAHAPGSSSRTFPSASCASCSSARCPGVPEPSC